MAENQQKSSGVVQVNFLDEHNHGVTLRQVVMDDFPVVISTSNDGTKKYSASLSDLLPAAIKNDSPIKERGGRMYRVHRARWTHVPPQYPRRSWAPPHRED
ncbi:hypothetical protein C8F04DRAFT_1265243 [Mycena alexandri]|uniref:Uncharacterized protein n=1 Tax=Mycena alexandri TaxID=1745969 RepID=A0AAD6SMU7_9AGAR|nr:hypothetical protein C8F04DRAFT_1265243 [Mycena alexandri]